MTIRRPFDRLDDEIFEDFSKTFPHYVENLDSLAKLDEDQVKSNEGKDQWRDFMGRYVPNQKWKELPPLKDHAQIRKEDQRLQLWNFATSRLQR